MEVSHDMREGGFRIITIGITNNVDRGQLQKIGGGHFYEAKNWELLRTPSFIKSMTDSVCAVVSK